eukprot:487469_1
MKRVFPDGGFDDTSTTHRRYKLNTRTYRWRRHMSKYRDIPELSSIYEKEEDQSSFFDVFAAIYISKLNEKMNFGNIIMQDIAEFATGSFEECICCHELISIEQLDCRKCYEICV